MIPLEDKDNYYPVKQVLELVGISESHFRRILKDYREFIPSKKAMRNKDLFSMASMETIKHIVSYKQSGLSKDEIIPYLQKSNSVAKSRLENPDFLRKTSIQKFAKDETDSEVFHLITELSSKCKLQDKEISSLKKTLQKRTTNYQNDMKELKSLLDTHKTELNILTQKIILMEQEKLDWKKKSWFRKLMEMFS